MYVNINIKGNNKGSVSVLADYLDKDDSTYFCDKNHNEVSRETVIKGIDKNTKSLGKNDSKFYMLTLNASDFELNFIKGNKCRISNFSKLSYYNKEQIYDFYKSYVDTVMDNYAKSFNRDNIKGKEDLVYYYRIETERHYRHYDKEVIKGNKRVNQKKEGLNVHVHIIVSRNSVNSKSKLSPNKKFRGSTFNGGKVTRGFSYDDFIDNNLEDFKSLTGFSSSSFYKSSKRSFSKSVKSSSDSSLANGIKGSAKGKATGMLQGKVLSTVTQDTLKDEMKIAGGVQEVTSIIKHIAKANPKVLAKDLAVKAIKTLLNVSSKGAEL